MRAIAEWRVCAVFALAPPDRFLFCDFEFHWLHTAAFVRAITKRLMGGAAAGTPPMDACFYFECERLCVTDNWFFGHVNELSRTRDSVREGN